MRRASVLFLVFLSVFLSPGNACSIIIEGSVWSTNATYYAERPNEGPPQGVAADANFQVADINFDSARVQQPKNITFNEFLNYPTWFIPSDSKFDPDKKMFANNGQGNGDEGVFFSFSIPLDLTSGLSLPVTLVFDDGVEFSILNQVLFGEPDPDGGPRTAKFAIGGYDTGQYTGILQYGALSDGVPDVLIFRTPEPFTILLLGIGLVALGIAACRRSR